MRGIDFTHSLIYVETVSLITTAKYCVHLFDLVYGYLTFNRKYFYIWITLGFSSFKWYVNDHLLNLFSRRNQRSKINESYCRYQVSILKFRRPAKLLTLITTLQQNTSKNLLIMEKTFYDLSCQEKQQRSITKFCRADQTLS